MNLHRIIRIIRKEFIQLRRDPRLLRMVLIAPVFQLFIFGYSVTTDVTHISTAVLDEDRTSASRALTERFVRSRYFDFDHYLSRPDQIDHLLDMGRAQMVLRIPRGFAKDLARGRTAEVQIILDGSDSMTASIISGYANGVLREHSAGIVAERLDRIAFMGTGSAGSSAVPVPQAKPPLPSLDPRLRVWYNPELKSVYFMVPAIMCTVLMVITTLLTSLAIVKEREIGTLEQLIVTPIHPRELMIGKTVPFIIIGLVDMTLVLLAAVLWFRVPVAGSMPLLFLLSAAFLLTTLGIGLFISTVSRTQQQAMMTTFFFLLPSFLLSGFMFPIENMPRLIQYITYAIPLRYFLVIVRGIFLKGNGLSVLWPQVLILTAFGLAIMRLAAARFQKRLG
ncbi:MAG: ABC transporter permease [Armatimonadota bacterium]